MCCGVRLIFIDVWYMSCVWIVVKLTSRVDFPLKLDMTAYLLPTASADGAQQHSGSTVYQLTGIVMHGGSINAGHYSAYVRRSAPDAAAAKWFYITDSRVREASEAELLQREAYLLFYSLSVPATNPYAA
jgi:ubiquitin carboxyl-terminal hydrolase 22/27/51